MLEINTVTGEIVKAVSTGAGGANKLHPKVWTYNNRVLVVDADGNIHQYGNDDALAGTSSGFDISSGGDTFANADGRIFLIAPTTIQYVDINSDGSGITGNGSMPRNDTGGGQQQAYSAGPNGKVIGAYPTGTIYTYDVAAGTSTSVVPQTPSGYSGWPQSQGEVSTMVDSDGNFLLTQQYNAGWSSKTKTQVVTLNGMTGAESVLESYEGNGTYSNMPIARTPKWNGGNLYLPVLHDLTVVNGGVLIHKISTAGTEFGTIVPQGPGFVTSPMPKLNYVAMGDSYSSGEGNTPFIFGTDTAANKCHRSAQSFPRLLAADSSLNLNLVDFVSCSGATTADVLYGGGTDTGSWSEPAQVDALSSDTQIVTLTIGGNDIAFSDYAMGCVVSLCGPTTQLGLPFYSAMMGSINSYFESNLRTTYETILEKAPNADVYVLDYPYLVDPTGTGTVPIVDFDASGVYDIQTALNTAILGAVTDVRMDANHPTFYNRLHYVQTTDSSSPFTDKHLYTDNPEGSYFNDVSVLVNPEYSLHPNANGHTAYYEIVKGALN
jgi:lysophospholipase L1-like esterase